MRRLAAADIGSNTVHVLVADVHDGKLEEVSHHVEMPELGLQVEKHGLIGPRKRKSAVTALERVVKSARKDGFEHLIVGATQAVRQAVDGPELLAEASARLRFTVRLLSPEREARLSFEGVASRHAAHHGWVMCDLGGGSTELVAASGGELERWASLRLGSGSFAARFLSDPPKAAEREQLRRAALATLEDAPECDAEKLVATGGTASTLPLVLSRRRPPPLLSSMALLAAEERLDLQPAGRLARSLGIPAARVKALRGGVEILLLLLDFYGLDTVHVSHEGLRHGMLLEYLRRGEDWWQNSVSG